MDLLPFVHMSSGADRGEGSPEKYAAHFTGSKLTD